MTLNLYRVAQYFDGYLAHQVIVSAKDSESALEMVRNTDTEYPRCDGWDEAVVEMIGWKTGEQNKGMYI